MKFQDLQVASPQGSSDPGADMWSTLVRDIRGGDDRALTELYRIFCKGIRFYICRQLGPQDLDDRVHDTFLAVAQAIRRGDLHDPARLMGYVHTVVRRHVAGYIEQTVVRRQRLSSLDDGLAVLDPGANPEAAVIERQERNIAREVLERVSKRDREVLVRFYLREQTPAEICRDMRLSPTQFRLLKSRAKARFAVLGKRSLSADSDSFLT